MDAALISRLLILRALWRKRDGWDAGRIRQHQDQGLRQLRESAYAGSEFYRRWHEGLHDAPLAELPPITKADLMEHFDEAVTVPGLHLTDVERHLEDLVRADADPGMPWKGRWWAAATGGTTGRRGVFIWDRPEWSAVLASYSRAYDWAGMVAGLAHPLRAAVVSSRHPTHQSAAVAASLNSRWVPTLRLDATDPLEPTVTALNAFRPDLLVGYPSALRPLASEQLEGSLRISPKAVMSASEVLTAATARLLTQAWGAAPFDVYAATEAAGIASSCIYGNRHLYEDLVIAEPVDDHYAPVPPGTVGARTLVTVLFARTLPLIRYELSDRIGVDGRGCPCGRSFAVLAAVEGRAEDILHLPSSTGTVTVHPNLFHDILDDVPSAGWQVIQEQHRIYVLLAEPGPGVDPERLRGQITVALQSAGVQDVPAYVETVRALPRTPLGKAPMIKALRE